MSNGLTRLAAFAAVGSLWAAASAGAAPWVTKGPAGGHVYSVAVDVADANEVYVGVESGGQYNYAGGVYRSTDGGVTWTLINDGLTARPQALVTVPGNNTVYAGTDGGVFKTTDDGASWSAINSGITHSDVRALVGTIVTFYAATYGAGVFKTTNEGASWTPVNSGLTDLHVNALALFGANVYAGTPSGLFRSTDSGATWSALDVLPPPCNPPFERIGSITAIGLDPTSTNTVYVSLVEGGCGDTGVWKSLDFGTSWTQVNSGLPSPYYVYAIAIDADENVFAATDAGVYHTTIGGSTWAPISTGLSNPSVTAFAIGHFNLPRPIYAGTLAGLFKSTNTGASWSLLGPPASRVSSVLLGSGSGTVYAGLSGPGGGVYKSTTGGASWTSSSSGLGGAEVYALAKVPALPTKMYAGTPGGVFTSTDAGSTWTGPTLAGTFVVALAADPSAPNVAYAGTDGVYKTIDGGATWNPTAPLPFPATVSVTALAVSPAGTVYAGTFRGVYKSTTGGAAWTPVGITSFHVRALAINPTDPTIMYAAADGGGVFHSLDAGDTWSAINGTLSDFTLLSLTIAPATPSTIYAGSGAGSGVFRSIDSGSTWTSIGAGLPTRVSIANDLVTVLALAADSDGKLYAGTDGAGVSYLAVCGEPGLPDSDGDGRCDEGDNCPFASNPGQLDQDVDGVGDDCDNCPATTNPDQRDSDAQSGGDVCDLCPSDATDTCNLQQSAGVSVSSAGGMLTTPDGRITLLVPPGTFSEPTSVSITGGVSGSTYGVRTGDSTVIEAHFEPSGVVFPGGVMVVMTWPDVDDDSFVDATPGPGNTDIFEGDLRIWRNGAPLTINLRCADWGCGSTVCCDQDANTFTFPVFEFSEYIMGAVQCSPGSDGLIKIGKLDTAPGDDKLKFFGETVLPVPITPAIDPSATGARITIDDAVGGRIVAADIPGGFYDSLTGVGWKPNRSYTSWRYANPTGIAGIVSVKMKLSTRIPGALKFKIKGKNGSFAVSPANLPLRGRFVLDPDSEATGQCGDLQFPGPLNPACAFDPSGSSLTCQ